MTPDSFTASDRMLSLVESDAQLLMVLDRFGISLGFGDKTVDEVCDNDGADCRTFLTVCNFLSGRPYNETDISLPPLMGYLRRAHSYFIEYLLPSIRHKLLEAINSAECITDVALLLVKFFDDYVREVRRHMEHENKEIFAYVGRLLNEDFPGEFRITSYSKGHDSMTRKLNELKDVFMRHYNQKGNHILSSALCDIIACNADLTSHCDIENKLFIPAVERLESELKLKTPVKEQGESFSSSPSSVDSLTDREKEILSCVARGLANKEIADRLCLSVNTVTTYRRNISSKLQIHSVAGLTVFAILHNIVDINEVGTNHTSGRVAL